MKILFDANGCPVIEGATITPVLKGWSGDKKYRVETAQGERFLLRVAEKVQYRQMKADFADLRPVIKLGKAAQQPVVCGKAGKWAYAILTWVDGEDLASVLPGLTQAEQYTMGLQAGLLLQKIHSVVPAKPAEDGKSIFQRNISKEIACHTSIGMSPEESGIVIAYLKDNQNVLGGRPRTFRHGDYHTTNLIVMPDGTLGAIDFLAYYGDPWLDLCAISVGKDANAYYQTGLINGYFDGNPPAEFFAAMAYNFALDALTRVSPNDSPEVFEAGCRHIKNIFLWTDNFRNPVPTWYLQDWSAL